MWEKLSSSTEPGRVRDQQQAVYSTAEFMFCPPCWSWFLVEVAPQLDTLHSYTMVRTGEENQPREKSGLSYSHHEADRA